MTPQDAPDCGTHSDDCADYSEGVPDWGYWPRRLFSFEDTIAQWLMMAFTIAATFVLVFTLRSANKTNAAAIRASNAALEANDIMRQEQRPWVTLERDFRCEFLDRGGFQGELTWTYNYVNKGKSPAHNIVAEKRIIKSKNFPIIPRLIRDFEKKWTESEPRSSGVPIIFPGESTDFRRNLTITNIWAKGGEGKMVVDGEYYVLLVFIRYQLSSDPKAGFGWEVSGFSIEEADDFLGPFGFKLWSHSNYKIVR